MIYLLILLAFTISALMSMIIIPRILVVALKKRLFDIPDSRKVHKEAIPRLGGLSFAPSILFSLSFVSALYCAEYMHGQHSDHRNRVAEIVQRLHRINIQPHTFLSQQLCKLRISSSSFMSRHIKGNDSLLSETFQCFIYGRMLLSFIIHLTCSSFPVVMYRQIQFYHSAIVYCLKPAQ